MTGAWRVWPEALSRTLARQPAAKATLRTSVTGPRAVTASVSSPHGLVPTRVAVPRTAEFTVAAAARGPSATSETGPCRTAVPNTARPWR